jgi:hypothetical protein
MLHHVALVAGCMVHGSVEKGISVRTTLVLDVPASAMSSCDGSEQLGCGPSGAATQRRFRLHSRLPAGRPPAMTSSAWAAGLCASRSHSRTSFMSRRILSWHSASAVGGASEGRPARMQSRAGNARAAIIGVIQMSPERSRPARRSESESDRPPGACWAVCSGRNGHPSSARPCSVACGKQQRRSDFPGCQTFGRFRWDG